MQTFLPFPDFYASLKSLDQQRLGKQRVEAMQLINAIEGKTVGWRNHPAARMWKDYLPALKLYHNIALDVWIFRGYINKMTAYNIDKSKSITMPHWLGNEEFHRSHRSNLIRKFPSYYKIILGWDEPDNLPYVWPV